MRLRYHIAVAVLQAGSCNSDLTPGLGTSICCRCSPEKKRKKKKNFAIRRSTEALLVMKANEKQSKYLRCIAGGEDGIYTKEYHTAIKITRNFSPG